MKIVYYSFPFCIMVVVWAIYFNPPKPGYDEHGRLIVRGNVCYIVDGDTFDIVSDTNDKIRIRLQEIDAPEKKQSFGKESTEFLSKMIFERNVEIHTSKNDKYGRTLGDVYHNNMNINIEMVKEGYAWQYEMSKGGLEFKKLAVAEKEAKSKKRGLWVEENPLPPWKFRLYNHKK